MAKTYEQYQKELRKQAEKEFGDRVSAMSAHAGAQIAEEQLQIDQQAAKSEGALVEQKQEKTKAARRTIDAAAVQRIVDEQAAEERLAAMGLSHSGTYTAAMQGAANREETLRRHVASTMRAALDALDRDIEGVRSGAAADKEAVATTRWAKFVQDEAALWDSMKNRADEQALSLYKGDLSLEKAQIQAEVDRYESDNKTKADMYEADRKQETDKYEVDHKIEEVDQLVRDEVNAAKKAVIEMIDRALRNKSGDTYGLNAAGIVIKLEG